MNLPNSTRLSVALIILIGIISLRYYPILISGLILLTAILYNNNTIRPLKNYKFWIVILVLIVIVPIFSGDQDRSLFGIGYSSDQLAKTILMTLRGISVFLLFQVLTTNLNIDKVKPIFSKFGYRNFDVLYTLSKDIAPKIKSILNARYSLFKIDWNENKSFESFIKFLTNIFSDFINLSNSLSIKQNETFKISPEEFVNRTNFNKIPTIYIIVGDAGIGKTSWIEKVIKILIDNGNSLDGILSKKHIISDYKWNHNLINISTNEKRQLTTMDEIETSTKVGKFHFYDDTIRWGNHHLISICEVDFIFIDEIGLLEFDKKGFLSGLEHISENYRGNLIITIRSSLQARFDEFLTKYFKGMSTWKKEYIIL